MIVLLIIMGATSLQVRLLLALLLVFSTGQYPSCHGRNGGDSGAAAPGGAETAGGGKCMEREREALLAVRDDVWAGAADRDLPSWKSDDDCCRWKGVVCDHQSGHVVKLDLQYNPKWSIPTGTCKVNPSLLNLGSLRYLDLSGNYFYRSPLPSFIGSLVNLEYLYINNTYFAGSFPLELGNLHNLKYLDLSYGFSSSTTVKNLRWLSHLSHLQYLDMSELDLSAAHDWLQVISMLPSLSVLRLHYCELPINPPNTVLIPLGNFTSLSTLDLGSFGTLPYSTWPLWLSNISSLTTLVLSNRLNCTVPPEAFKNMKHLEVLSMYADEDKEYGLRGLIPRSLWRLDKLKSLYLSGHDLRIGSSEDMGHLNSLRELTLSNVVGRLPDSLGNIMGLQSMSIQADVSSIGGWLPESIGKLVGLQTLMVSGFNTSGEVLRNMGDLCNLTKLTIKGNKADGEEVTKLLEGLSECIGGSALEWLEISENRYRGHLPDQLGKLKNLQYLDLSGNSIVDSIPASIGELESLTHLVPSSIGKLSNLTSMDLSDNRLEGDLSEAHFSHLSQLDVVHLSNNAALSLNTSQTWIPPFQLSLFKMSDCNVGPEFPKWLQTKKKIDLLDLSSNIISYSTVEDDIKGIPSSICQLKSLTILNLSYNHFSGQIPDCWRGGDLKSMDFSSNSLVGHIPSSIGMLSNLQLLHLKKNALTGSIPLSLKKCTMLEVLDLSENNLSGEIPSWLVESLPTLKSLHVLDLSHNSLVGHIPSSIGMLSDLVALDLSHNSLVGLIPSSIGNLSDLVVLDLSHNSLVGHIPSSIGMLSYLKLLHLDRNALIGSIPSSFKNCTKLKTLDLSENKLSGEIPSWLGQSLSSLSILSLRSNMFHGYLPISLSGLQSLQILDLANNTLSGSIILSFHNLTEMVKIEKHGLVIYVFYIESKSLVTKGTELQYTVNLPFVTMIDLSSNNFSGEFPREITNLHGLRFLNLSKNLLSGRIPENISTMGLLESLDLSFNQLNGRVPSTMSTMHFLSFLNLSYNSLSGRIPSGQIQTFDKYSFVGNPDLCGVPILGLCPGDAFQTSEGDASHDEHESHMAWFYVSLGPGFVTGFLGFLGVFSLMRRSWRIAYFRFFDSLGDTLYVFVVVRCARLKVKLSAWRGGGSSV